MKPRGVLIAAVGLIALAHLASVPTAAAPARLSFSDPKGDVELADPSQSPGAQGLDLLGVTVELKDLPPRSLPHLMISWELAGPPTARAVTYELGGLVDGCGALRAVVHVGTVSDAVWVPIYGQSLANQFYVDCGPSGSRTHLPSESGIDGNVVRIWAPLGRFPKEARSGAITRLRAFTAFSEPVIGLIHTGYFKPSDEAVAPTAFRY